VDKRLSNKKLPYNSLMAARFKGNWKDEHSILRQEMESSPCGEYSDALL
jgi:hypothetical protein